MGLQQLFAGVLTFINTFLFPLLMAIAVLIFLWNIVRYFIIGGGNEEDQSKAKTLALWGILAFVAIASIWGIVNIFVGIFGLGGHAPITPDYIGSKSGPKF